MDEPRRQELGKLWAATDNVVVNLKTQIAIFGYNPTKIVPGEQPMFEPVFAEDISVFCRGDEVAPDVAKKIEEIRGDLLYAITAIGIILHGIALRVFAEEPLRELEEACSSVLPGVADMLRSTRESLVTDGWPQKITEIQ